MHFIQKNNYVLFVLVLCILFTVVGTMKMNREANYEKIIVTEGDTLWGYSVQYAEKVPVERWIEDVMTLNDLSSTTIQVGDELRIPASKGTSPRHVATHMAGEDE